MEIYQVTSPEFVPYGKIVEGFPVDSLLEALKKTRQPESGTAYVPEEELLQSLPILPRVRDSFYGGMPVQLGWCNGYNTKLNCLEYHRDSEYNLGTEDFILLLAKEDQIEDGVLDTSKVKAFLVPAGVLVEVYATTLHFAPCSVSGKEFRMGVALPRGTNEPLDVVPEKNGENQLLLQRNKWLLAHKDSGLDKDGAWIGLVGENIEIR